MGDLERWVGELASHLGGQGAYPLGLRFSLTRC